ncbi:DUF6157 family protein [Kineococcus esterisolvens]|uniref:DUF6157 family protein n=1 Tax=unclassified Kineococcus TaxID=2621656 RepID=UPI003D7D2486
MGYRDTFISVAEDCRAPTGEAPPARAKPTVAGVQHAMLTARPGHYTQEEVLLASSPEVRAREAVDGRPAGLEQLPAEELQQLLEEHFASPRACLRASPLPKTYGWGLHFDEAGRITAHAVDSPGYARLSTDPSLTQLKAMRSRRAG